MGVRTGLLGATTGGMMPIKVPTLCKWPGCPNVTRSGSYCATHARANERQRGSAAQRGYDSGWRRVRARYLAAHPWCADPFGVHGGVPVAATDVDHIQRRRSGGSDDDSNLQALCHACHSRKTVVEGRGGQISANPQKETVRYLSSHTREIGEGGVEGLEGGYGR